MVEALPGAGRQSIYENHLYCRWKDITNEDIDIIMKKLGYIPRRNPKYIIDGKLITEINPLERNAKWTHTA